MDLSNASTDAFTTFHKYRERLISAVEASTAGLVLLRNIVDVDNGGYVLGALVDSTGEPWSEEDIYPEPVDTVNTSIGVFSNLMVVQFISGFDWFAQKLMRDICEFTTGIHERDAWEHDHEDSEITSESWRRASCCATKATKAVSSIDQVPNEVPTMLGVDLRGDLASITDLYHYFRLIRNRISHNNSVVGERLAEKSQSEGLHKAHEEWKQRFTRNQSSPDIPEFETGDRIDLNPHHSILAGAVVYEYAKFFNEASIDVLGQEGMTAMAAYYSLFEDEHIFRDENYNTHSAPVNHFLYRYRVQDIEDDKTRSILRELNLWEPVVGKFNAKYN